MHQAATELTISTRGRGLTEITDEARAFVKDARMDTGTLTLFCRHTSASILIQENADRDVQRDLVAFFRRLVPDGDPLFIHTAEGPDDMPAHVRTALTQTSITVPITGGRLALGTWQGIFLFEHRAAPHRRNIRLHAIGE